MISAKDIMRDRVVTLGPDMTLKEAAELFERAGISGAPVVGPGRKLLGVLSQTDLTRREREQEQNRVPAFYREGGLLRMARPLDSALLTRVSEVMTPAVLAADEGTPVRALAAIMVARRVHRVVIVRDGALRGIVTTMDILRVVAAGGTSRPASGPAPRPRPGRRPEARSRSRRFSSRTARTRG